MALDNTGQSGAWRISGATRPDTRGLVAHSPVRRTRERHGAERLLADGTYGAYTVDVVLTDCAADESMPVADY